MKRKQKWRKISIVLVAITAVYFWKKTIVALAWKPEKKVIARIPVKPEITATKNKLQLAKKEASQKIQQASAAANKVVTLGLNKLGCPYVWGGTSEKGFDCSGFVQFVFKKSGVEVPRSSELLAEAGKPIPRIAARRGDILIFTGTNSSIRKPGHVGIVISKKGETLSFVHASSYGGVKISQVDGTNYDRRFLEVRRVL